MKHISISEQEDEEGMTMYVPYILDLQSLAKIMRLFTFLAILKYVGLPPAPHDQCWKKWVEFSLFSHPHNIELGVRGAFMRLSQ
jgi:hypothetical protein